MFILIYISSDVCLAISRREKKATKFLWAKFVSNEPQDFLKQTS